MAKKLKETQMDKKIQNGLSIFSFLPRQTDKFERLVNLALDMRWSWSHYADKLWSGLDPVLWNLTQNPWAVLLACSREKLEAILDDRAFNEELEKIIIQKPESENKPAWFQSTT
jgi:starch phosphorylase